MLIKGWRYVTAVVAILVHTSLSGAVCFRESKEPEIPLDVLFEEGSIAYTDNMWPNASFAFGKILSSPCASKELQKRAAFYLGVAEFYQAHWKQTNDAFDFYLEQPQKPEHFDTAIQYKFEMAEILRYGSKVYRCCRSYKPYWEKGDYLALKIYSQIALAVPSSDLAARSLSNKGEILIGLGAFEEAVQTYGFLLRRFPKHELAADAYRNILHAYLLRAAIERNNPDILPLAKVTLEKFRKSFPGDPRVVEGECMLLQIENFRAECLYETGIFYENVEAPRAAFICYNTCMQQFPFSATAALCLNKLRRLGRYIPPKEECMIEETEL